MGSKLVFHGLPRQNNMGPSILPLGYWGSWLTFQAIQYYDPLCLGLFPALGCELCKVRGHVGWLLLSLLPTQYLVCCLH